MFFSSSGSKRGTFVTFHLLIFAEHTRNTVQKCQNMQRKWNCTRWMLPLIWILQNKEKRTPFWVYALLYLYLMKNEVFHTVTQTTRKEKIRVLPFKLLIEILWHWVLGSLEGANIKPFLIGHFRSSCPKPLFQCEAKWHDNDFLFSWK